MVTGAALAYIGGVASFVTLCNWKLRILWFCFCSRQFSQFLSLLLYIHASLTLCGSNVQCMMEKRFLYNRFEHKCFCTVLAWNTFLTCGAYSKLLVSKWNRSLSPEKMKIAEGATTPTFWAKRRGRLYTYEIFRSVPSLSMRVKVIRRLSWHRSSYWEVWDTGYSPHLENICGKILIALNN